MEIEYRVIGALIINPKSVYKLDGDVFEIEACKSMYELIKYRHGLNIGCDTLSIGDHVESKYLDAFFRCVSFECSTESFIDEDIASLKRNHNIKHGVMQIEALRRSIKKAPYDVEKERVLTEGIKSIVLMTEQSCFDYQNLPEALDEDVFLDTGINGFPSFQNKSMVTICGRAGIGKTFFAINIMDKLLRRNGGSALFFSLEMPSQSIYKRHIHNAGDVSGLNVKIYDSNCSTIQQIESICRLNTGVSVVVVDYIGLVKSSDKHEKHYLQQADISQRLASLSMELNCIVIALSQVNRDYKSRKESDQCPYPTDAADSSGSERSSSIWIGINRRDNIFEIKCRKNRNGSNFEVFCNFDDGKFNATHKHYQEECTTCGI